MSGFLILLDRVQNELTRIRIADISTAADVQAADAGRQP
ncbi:protein of unassigned function [Methylobacterium oryzae CBMB20]|uniref:Protein of unassigned function n=1 Tax=Methylobacterium oryzae CBMB20 TaxID=693986 RepID=A0A089NR58_9HYPH|nr:protein of unassigned function [Methylobacterium oryzae CBMB20]